MNPMPSAALLRCVGAWFGAAGLLGACVADNGKERTARKPPADARAERLVLAVDGKFHDTDANGYGDTVQVFAYVFGNPARYELPLVAEGSFAFSLVQVRGEHPSSGLLLVGG